MVLVSRGGAPSLEQEIRVAERRIGEALANLFVFKALREGRLGDALEVARRLASIDPKYAFLPRYIEEYAALQRDASEVSRAGNLGDLEAALKRLYSDIVEMEETLASAGVSIPPSLSEEKAEVSEALGLIEAVAPLLSELSSLRRRIEEEIDRFSAILSRAASNPREMWREGRDLVELGKRLEELVGKEYDLALKLLDILGRAKVGGKPLAEDIARSLYSYVASGLDRTYGRAIAAAAEAIGSYMMNAGAILTAFEDLRERIESWLRGEHPLSSVMPYIKGDLSLIAGALPELEKVPDVASRAYEVVERLAPYSPSFARLASDLLRIASASRELAARIRKALRNVFQHLVDSDLRFAEVAPLLASMGIPIHVPSTPIERLRAATSTILDQLSDFSSWAWEQADGTLWKEALAALASAASAVAEMPVSLAWLFTHLDEVANAIRGGISALAEAIKGNPKPLEEGLKAMYTAMFGSRARAAETIAGLAIPFLLPLKVSETASLGARVAVALFSGDVIGPLIEPIIKESSVLARRMFAVVKAGEEARVIDELGRVIGARELERAVASALRRAGLTETLSYALAKRLLEERSIIKIANEAVRELERSEIESLALRYGKALASLLRDLEELSRLSRKLAGEVLERVESVGKLGRLYESLGPALSRLASLAKEVEKSLARVAGERVALSSVRSAIESAGGNVEVALEMLDRLRKVASELRALEIILEGIERAFPEGAGRLREALSKIEAELSKIDPERLEAIDRELRRLLNDIALLRVTASVKSDIVGVLKSPRFAALPYAERRNLAELLERGNVSEFLSELRSLLESRLVEARELAVEIARVLSKGMKEVEESAKGFLAREIRAALKGLGAFVEEARVASEELSRLSREFGAFLIGLAREIEGIEPETGKILARLGSEIEKGNWGALYEYLALLKRNPLLLAYVKRVLERLNAESEALKTVRVSPSDVLTPFKRYLEEIEALVKEFAPGKEGEVRSIIERIERDVSDLLEGRKGAVGRFVKDFAELRRTLAKISREDLPLLYRAKEALRNALRKLIDSMKRRGAEDELLESVARDLYSIIKSEAEGVGKIEVVATRELAVVTSPEDYAEVARLFKGGVVKEIEVPGVGRMTVTIRGVVEPDGSIRYEAVARLGEFEIRVWKRFRYDPKSKSVIVVEGYWIDPRLEEAASRNVVELAMVEKAIGKLEKALPSKIPALVGRSVERLVPLGSLAPVLAELAKALERVGLRNAKLLTLEASAVEAAKLKGAPVLKVPKSLGELARRAGLEPLGVVQIARNAGALIVAGDLSSILRRVVQFVKLETEGGKTVVLPVLKLDGQRLVVIPVIRNLPRVTSPALFEEIEKLLLVLAQRLKQANLLVSVPAPLPTTIEVSIPKPAPAPPPPPTTGKPPPGGVALPSGVPPIFVPTAGLPSLGITVGEVVSAVQKEVLHL